MSALELVPDDLRAFLSRGDQLQYDATDSQVGNVALYSADQLSLALFSVNCEDTDVAEEDPHQDDGGTYLVEGVDLIADADGGYGSAGLLIWLPQDQRYAAWDSSHNEMFVFAEATRWDDIAQAPLRYLDAQWQAGDTVAITPLRPWPHHAYNEEQTYEKFSYPAEWFELEETLRGVYEDGVQKRLPHQIELKLTGDGQTLQLTATRSTIDAEGKSIVQQTAERALTASESESVREMLQAHFWEGEEPETDLGETLLMGGMRAFREKEYRSLFWFSSNVANDSEVKQLNDWLVKLAGLQPLEESLA